MPYPPSPGDTLLVELGQMTWTRIKYSKLLLTKSMTFGRFEARIKKPGNTEPPENIESNSPVHAWLSYDFIRERFGGRNPKVGPRWITGKDDNQVTQKDVFEEEVLEIPLTEGEGWFSVMIPAISAWLKQDAPVHDYGIVSPDADEVIYQGRFWCPNRDLFDELLKVNKNKGMDVQLSKCKLDG